MQTLFTFYRSKEWENLLAVLKQERVDADGQIVCEYCGKPIVKAYDIIGHHKEELTEENVNDANVALNPANVMFVHHRCHNYIHRKLEYKSREVYLVYGSPLSGKSTWVHDNMDEGDLVIDIDNIWECVSGCDRNIKPKRLNAVVFKMRDTLIDAVKYRLGRWRCAYIVGGYPLQSERDLLCRQTGAREVFIDTPKQECLERIKGAGRDEQTVMKYIHEWFDRYGTADG